MNKKHLDTPLTENSKRWFSLGWKLLTVLVITATVLAGLPAPVSKAIYNDTPPAQTGFPVQLTGGPVDLSSPTVADLDGDGKLEIIVGGRGVNTDGSPSCDGWVYAYRSNGTLYWQTRVQAPVNASPTVADLNGDGKPEVLVGLGGIATSSPCWNGGVVALNGQTGASIWTFATQDWLNHQPDGWKDGVISTPAVGDINGDGKPEVVFGAWDQCLYALDHNGVPLWGNLPGLLPQLYCGGHGFYNEDTFWSSPSLADINNDGKLEIITGADITAGNVYHDPSGGYVYILDGQGKILAQTWLDQRIYSSPAVADIDNDQQYEIVIGTGTDLPGAGYYVSAYDIDLSQPTPRGRLILKWRSATGGRVFTSPAIGDMNGDGMLDVVATAYIGDNGTTGSEVFAWDGKTGQQLFRTRACNYDGNSFATQSSPTLADIDGDGKLEVLFSHGWEVDILNHDGTHYTDYANPTVPGSPVISACARTTAPTTTKTFYARYTVNASPTVADLDGNGKAEVVIAGGYDYNNIHGGIYVWTGLANGARPWPMFHHDAAHIGTIAMLPRQSVAPSSLLALHDINDSTNQHITVRVVNTGGGSFGWTATAPAGVTVSPSSGTVTTATDVIVTIPSSQYRAAGTYNLGNITFTATGSGGSVVIDGNASLPVQLRVAKLSQVYLPLVKRN